jgi:hypothetical protein
MLGALSPGIKRLVREVDHSLLFNADANNGGVIPPLPTRLYGVMFNSLSTGIILPFMYRKAKEGCFSRKLEQL